MSGFIVSKSYAKLLKKAHKEGRAMQGLDILVKIRDSLAAKEKLLAELKEVKP